jgi:hypothetical protein
MLQGAPRNSPTMMAEDFFVPGPGAAYPVSVTSGQLTNVGNVTDSTLYIYPSSTPVLPAPTRLPPGVVTNPLAARAILDLTAGMLRLPNVTASVFTTMMRPLVEQMGASVRSLDAHREVGSSALLVRSLMLLAQVASYAWPAPNTPTFEFSDINVTYSTAYSTSPLSMLVHLQIDITFPASYTVPDADTLQNMVAGALRARSVKDDINTIGGPVARQVNLKVGALRRAAGLQFLS